MFVRLKFRLSLTKPRRCTQLLDFVVELFCRKLG